MNIKNRLQKLESRTGAAEFCKCLSPKCQIEYYEDGKPSATMQNPEPIADVCGECGKPIEKQIIQVDFVSREIPNPCKSKCLRNKPKE